MRSSLWFWVVVAGVASAPAEATRHHPRLMRGVRTVELIVMPQVADDQTAASPPATNVFQTHDLSRRWAEQQVRATLVSADQLGEERASAAEDPFRPQARATGREAMATFVAPASAIAVPTWMRGASLAPLPTRFAPGCVSMPYRPTGFLKFDAETRRQTYYGMMSSIACEFGIPVGLFDAMIIRESRYRSDIFSAKNAFGLTQLMPDTAAGLGIDRYDVEQNLRGGARYLRQQLDRFGQVHLALAAYNAGPGRVRNGMLPQIAETQAYVDNVLRNWRRLAGITSATSAPFNGAPGVGALSPGRLVTIRSF